MDDARADFSRTCDGCAFLKSEDWARGKIAYRCFAPGPNKGYHMGTERVFPWVPAWCPVKLREIEPLALIQPEDLREEAVQKWPKLGGIA